MATFDKDRRAFVRGSTATLVGLAAIRAAAQPGAERYGPSSAPGEQPVAIDPNHQRDAYEVAALDTMPIPFDHRRKLFHQMNAERLFHL